MRLRKAGPNTIPFIITHYRQLSKYIKGWGGAATADILTKALAFSLIPIYAKLMSPNEFGSFSYSIMIASVASSVFGLGQYAIYTRSEADGSEIAKKRRSETLCNAFLGMLTWVIILLLIQNLFPSAIFQSKQPNPVWIFLFTQPILLIISQLITIDLFLTQSYKTAAIRAVLEAFLSHTLSLVFIYIFPNNSCTARLAGTAIAILLSIICFLPKTRILNALQSIRFVPGSMPLNYHLIREGSSISLSAVLGLLSSNGDRYLTEKLATRVQLGYLTFASNFSSIISMGFSSFNNVWLGVFYQEKRTDKWRYKYTLIAFFAWILIGACITSLGILAFSFFSENLKNFQHSKIIIVPLAVAACLQIAGHLISNYFNLWGKNHWLPVANAGAAMASIVAGFILIPRFGAIGASFQAIISASTNTILLLAIAVWLEKTRVRKITNPRTV